ncbi:MAG: alpha/beta fold hydrolase [Micromonosporaceae bacterium]
MDVLPDGVAAWRDTGRQLDVDGRRVFVVDTGDPAAGVPVVILHGFPGSSYDWVGVVPLLARHRRVVVCDLPGYGLSAKPPDASYSLFALADSVTAVLTALGVERCVLLAHDIGDTIAAELLHRHHAGTLPVAIERVFLTNGSIFIDQARLTRGQRLALAMPGRALPFPLPRWLLRHSLRESFAPDAPAPPGAIDAMVSLIEYGGGARLLTKQIRYIRERRTHQARWTAALVDYPGPMTALWGERDPIAVLAMPRRLTELRPGTELVTWPDAGHWPSIEAPVRLAEAITSRL